MLLQPCDSVDNQKNNDVYLNDYIVEGTSKQDQMSDHFYDQFVDDICDDVSSEIQVNSSVETNTLSISDQLCDNQLPPMYNCFMIE